MLELWHEWNSVHSFKVRVVLAEKELAWTGRHVALLKFEHLRPEYLRLNPNGVVPTLVHDGRTILESSIICQYLDEQFPQPPLLPPDAYGRARALAWLNYFDAVLHPALRAVSFELLYRPLLAALPREELERKLASHPDPARARDYLGRLKWFCHIIDAADFKSAHFIERVIERADKNNRDISGDRIGF